PLRPSPPPPAPYPTLFRSPLRQVGDGVTRDRTGTEQVGHGRPTERPRDGAVVVGQPRSQRRRGRVRVRRSLRPRLPCRSSDGSTGNGLYPLQALLADRLHEVLTERLRSRGVPVTVASVLRPVRVEPL